MGTIRESNMRLPNSYSWEATHNEASRINDRLFRGVQVEAKMVLIEA